MSNESPLFPESLNRAMLVSLMYASRVVNERLDIDEVCREITRQAAAVTDAQGASLLLLDAAGNQLVFHTVIGLAEDVLAGERMPSDEGIAGRVMRTGQAAIVHDAQADKDFFTNIDGRTGVHTRSLIAVPLVYQGQALGVVEAVNPNGRERFEDVDVHLLDVLANLVAAAVHNAQLYSRASHDNQALRAASPGAHLVGQSEARQQIIQLCRKVAMTDTTVLLTGETGTGKEVVARMLCETSARNERPFIPVNCAALPENLLESELFGHEKGAFTGADKQRIGWFEMATGGTLFLDEIGEITPPVQVKLLRVLQEKQLTRVGGSKSVDCDVRLIAATNRNLAQRIKQGEFREDLYYRLNVFPIHIPPLRDRVDDVGPLIEHFLEQIAPTLGRPLPAVDPDAMSCLMRYAWPGNVRELRNIVERAVLLADDCIAVQHLPPEIASSTGTAAGAAPLTAGDTDVAPSDLSCTDVSGDASGAVGGGSTLAEHERALIIQALDASDWNQSKAARHLGVSRDNMRYRMKKYGITRR